MQPAAGTSALTGGARPDEEILLVNVMLQVATSHACIRRQFFRPAKSAPGRLPRFVSVHRLLCGLKLRSATMTSTRSLSLTINSVSAQLQRLQPCYLGQEKFRPLLRGPKILLEVTRASSLGGFFDLIVCTTNSDVSFDSRYKAHLYSVPGSAAAVRRYEARQKRLLALTCSSNSVPTKADG